jgi:hypothetical protein
MTDGMADAEDVHLYTELGALCGVPPPYRWTLNDARTTCAACREMLDAGLRRRPVAGSRVTNGAVALGGIWETG